MNGVSRYVSHSKLTTTQLVNIHVRNTCAAHFSGLFLVVLLLGCFSRVFLFPLYIMPSQQHTNNIELKFLQQKRIHYACLYY